MAIKPIEILINAKDNASGVFSSLQSKVAAVGVAIASYFGVKAFVGVVEGAADFEAALSRVKAATGATAEEMVQLKKAAEDAGANTKYTSSEAAAALETLGKAGLSAKDAIATLPAVLNLAQAGDVDLAQASEFVTKAVMGMGLAFTDAARVADVLALGANATNTSVSGLAEALSYAAPVAQSAGVSLEGTVAIMGKLADAGIDASRSGTAVSNMLAQFSDPASTFKRALADAGITTNNFEQALHQLAAAGPRGEKAILAVGLNAGPALRALLNQGMPALDELKAKLEGAAGSAAATAKVMEDNLKGSMTGLASAWDTVKNVLGTPVLPVIKDGVDQLAGAFRSAVADGTIQKFGEAIATAFQAGIKWVREFIGQVDFTQVAADLRAFADRAGEAFTQIGEHATTAGGVVKTAYGVMSSGANAVMTAIYGIAASYTEASIRIVDFAAHASDALSKISIGKAKQELQQQAEDMRGVLGGLAAVRDAFIAKTLESLDATAQSAQTARDGFAGLVGGMSSAAGQASNTSAALASVAKELTAGAEAAAAAGVAAQKKAAADQSAKQAAMDHGAAVAQLKAEYGDLVASGNLQGAAEKLQEVNKALRDTAPAAKDAAKAAADAAAQIEAAFGRLGVTSSAALKDAASNAVRDYEVIKNAGTSTAEDISAAFKVAAEKAIAANKGIAPSWVEAEAAARGFKLEVDATGKTIVKSMSDAKKSVQDVGTAARQAAGEFDYLGQRIEYTSEKARLLHQQGQILAASLEEQNQRTANSSITKTQGKINPIDAVPTFNTRAEADAWLEEAKKQYARDNPFTTNSSGSLGNMGMDLMMAEWRAEIDSLALRDAMKNTNGGTSPGTTSNMPTPGTTTGTTVNINVEGVRRSINTDAAGADALQDLIRQLTAGKGTYQ